MKNTDKQKVSVIIPAYNAGNTIADCIDALLAQDYPKEGYEIIVVNDASTDETPMILEKYEDRGLISVVHHPENRALAAARNSGINVATGDILLFIDSDIIVLPDFIRKHMDYYANPEIFGVFSHLRPSPDIKYDKYQRYLYESKRGVKKHSPKNPIPYWAFLFTASSIRKSVIDQVGMFDENITHYGGEDTDFSYRIAINCPKGLFFAREIEVFHKHYRPIGEALKNVHSFGHFVVPYLIEKHPEFDKLYGYSFIFPPKTVTGLLKKTAGIILKSRPVFSIINTFYRIFPYPVSNIFVRLSLASALWQGIALSKTNS